MKQFFKNIFVFFVVLGLIFIIGLLLPVTPRSKNYMISIKPKKDSLLHEVKKPRIIFMGGSNIVFGLNSQMVKDSLHLNPINTGVAVGLGSIYMMDDVLPYVKKSDYIIFALEYELYFGNYAYGHNDLFRLLMDVESYGFKKLRWRHIPNLIKVVPDYFLSKFMLNNYIERKDEDIYGNKGFNEYGDSVLHWGAKKRNFSALTSILSEFNYIFFDELVKFNNKIKEKGAILYITYPGIQKKSFNNIKANVVRVQNELEKSDLVILGKPEEFIIPDSLMFDSPYHLTKKGLDIRTNLLIQEIKIKMKNE